MRPPLSDPRQLCIVTHVCRKNDGQGRVNFEIAKAALAAGWHVTVLAAELSEELSKHALVRWIRMPPAKLPTNLLKYHVFAIKTAFWLRRHRTEIDVLHVNGFITWEPADVNTAHFVHAGWLKSGYFPYRWGRSLYRTYQRFYTLSNLYLERKAFKESGIVIAISNKIKSELESIGVEREKIALIENGVDVDEFGPGAGSRVKFGLSEDRIYLLFAGDIRTSRKNLDTVLQAMRLIKDCDLVVAGRLEGSPYPEMAEKMAIAKRVHFLGMVDDVASLMRSVDLFVFPSRYEAMSLVILEAMASGLPVLTAKSAGGAEIVADGGRVLDDPDDIETLAAWVNELAARTDLRLEMGRRARAIAETFTWGVMSAKYLALYQNLL